ncbi:hypothetical protein D3C74_502200 [compost metagenome]
MQVQNIQGVIQGLENLHLSGALGQLLLKVQQHFEIQCQVMDGWFEDCQIHAAGGVELAA